MPIILSVISPEVDSATLSGSRDIREKSLDNPPKVIGCYSLLASSSGTMCVVHCGRGLKYLGCLGVQYIRGLSGIHWGIFNRVHCSERFTLVSHMY